MPNLLRIALACSLLYAPLALADALVPSEAMFADTIAEFYVAEDGVRVELEIGMNDVGGY